MGFLDFFKKIFAEKKEQEQEIEKLKVSDLNIWIGQREKEIKEKEKQIFNQIKIIINKIVKELEDEIKVLENIDLHNKKAVEKIKLIVRENLDNYVSYLKELIRNLQKLNKEETEDIIEEINSIFSNFNKHSKMSFEKATFLIGKEIDAVKESIGRFFRNLEKVLHENKEIIEKSKIISVIEMKISNLMKIKLFEKQFSQNIKDIKENKEDLKKQIQDLEKDIEKLKQSKEYSEKLKKEKESEVKKKDLQAQVYELKKIIDLRDLARKFHSNEKEMETIRKYRENFKGFFEKDKGKGIIELFDFNEKKQEIFERIKQINKISKEIEESIINGVEIDDFKQKIKEIQLKIKNLDVEESRRIKKFKKIGLQEKEILDEIKKNLKEINVILE